MSSIYRIFLRVNLSLFNFGVLISYHPLMDIEYTLLLLPYKSEITPPQ